MRKKMIILRVAGDLALVAILLAVSIPYALAANQTWSAMRLPQVVNVGSVGPIAVAEDGTIFAVTGGNRVRSSASGGADWSAAVNPITDSQATAGYDTIGAIAVSPNYLTDSMVFVTLYDSAATNVAPTVNISNDGGVTFAPISTVGVGVLSAAANAIVANTVSVLAMTTDPVEAGFAVNDVVTVSTAPAGTRYVVAAVDAVADTISVIGPTASANNADATIVERNPTPTVMTHPLGPAANPIVANVPSPISAFAGDFTADGFGVNDVITVSTAPAGSRYVVCVVAPLTLTVIGPTASLNNANAIVAEQALSGLDTGPFAGDVPQSLTIAPDFNTNGTIAVGLNPNGATNAVFTETRTAGAWSGSWTGIGPAMAAAGDNGAWVAFSPNYVSDGLLMEVVSTVAANTREGRSAAGAAFAGFVNICASQTTTADFAFPDDFDTAGADNYFLAIDDGIGANGTVYRREPGAWVPSDPTGGMIDMTDIVASGDYSTATVFAGAQATGTVYKSTTGCTTWVTPGAAATLYGADTTYLALSQAYASDNVVYGATSGVNGGFHKSTTGAAGWYGYRLYNDNYNSITGLAISPNFNTDQTAFLVENGGAGTHAVFRTTNAKAGTPLGALAGWDKVSTLANVTSVAVSPYFATDGVVYIADNGTQVSKSTNKGQWFSTAFISAIPSGTIVGTNALTVADSDTVFVIATLDWLHRTTDSGSTWTTWNSGLQGIDSVVISPNYGNDSTVVASGRTSTGAGAVYISTDGGVTWTPVGTGPTTWGVNKCLAVFSANYATDSTIFAASNAGTGDVYRWLVGTSTSWLDLDMLAGAAAAAPNVPCDSDTANLAMGGTGMLYAADTTAASGLYRATYPTAAYDGTETTWLDLGWWPEEAPEVCEGGSGRLDQTVPALSTFNLAGGLQIAGNEIVAVDTAAAPQALYIYTDNLTDPVQLVSPPSGEVRTEHPTTAQWATYSGVPGVNYQVQVARDDFTFKDTVNTALSDPQAGVSINIGDFAPTFVPGHNYYWRVRAQANAAADVASPWSEVWSYSSGGDGGGGCFITTPFSPGR